MKMFSDCRGPCLVCACGGIGCLAGHGDDDFVLAPREQLQAMLDTGYWGDPSNGYKLTEWELVEVRKWIGEAK
jgi:hypothetical protein